MLRIKEIMRDKNITVQELADKMGVTSSCISRYINGNPTVSTLYKIAEALEVSINDLFNEQEQSLEGYLMISGNFYKITNLTDLRKALDFAEQKANEK
ncbi:helix-turn-helix domain-containing protein [uncultured Bacteroides sp.]|uniref:helix-turn-helix domain-containing protein n=1 Tax=uncultured Bacteroides sp. TaxID=162156 RepID=UPI002611C844|nr:helix-turn-helix transcriptional regulator [uncultured Bacteroides sp.]